MALSLCTKLLLLPVEVAEEAVEALVPQVVLAYNLVALVELELPLGMVVLVALQHTETY